MAFNASECNLCGICFHKCPEMHLPIEIAKDEIAKLIRSENGEHVLWNCASCFSCNNYCPNNCNPYQLILSNWNRLYNERGAPSTDKLVCPSIDGNLWQMLYVLTPENEKNRIKNWQKPLDQRESMGSNKPILLIGNLAHIMSFILNESPLLNDFILLDALDQWECGGYLYQLGYLDVVDKVSRKCNNDFMKISESTTIIPVLDAVHHMLTQVYPDELNMPIKHQIVNFHKFMLQKIQKDEIKIVNPDNLPFQTITIHDNCFSKVSSDYWDIPRQIFKQCGYKITEMNNIRNDSRCCGFGAGCSWEKNSQIVFDIMATSGQKLQEAKETGADAFVTYCGGCYFILWAANELFNTDLRIYHSFELIRIASGEELDQYQSLQIERAWDLIAIFTVNLFKGLFSKNFKIDSVEAIPPTKRFTFLRIIRWFLRSNLIQKIYRRFFLFLLKRREKKK